MIEGSMVDEIELRADDGLLINVVKIRIYCSLWIYEALSFFICRVHRRFVKRQSE
jgi:hypothetical protein